jgi:phosphoribosylglycinamide formyltransferase-1
VKLGVLVSGRGSNLEAVLEAVASGSLHRVQPVIVISNRPRVRALEVAAHYGVPSRVLRRAEFGGHGDARDRAIGQVLDDAAVELALLAGYDQVLGPGYFSAFRGRTINIHPSLLPAHGGRGMVGGAVHASVLEHGDPQTGVTIHDVTADLDGGPAIAQARVPVLPGDDVARLAARVLAVEHRCLVETLTRLAEPGNGMARARMTRASAPERSPHPLGGRPLP